MYDRYFIIPFVTIPLFILSIESENENKSEHTISRGYSAIFIAFLTITTTALTHDYLEWNREKWNSLNSLLEKKIQPQEINGGFEFSGQYLYTNYTKNNKKGFWVIDDKYKVTTSTKDEATENYTILNKKKINTWLPMSIKYVYTLRRNN
ncbi:hypothetical protein [Aquitalea sp.]|uniref:hypothetical protein n=1 Tax=Aquitalea sp. TaxID=1872623 RepID=UPI00258F8120|nr:hypothetical protein [Aquitalea sp.]